MKSQSEIDAMNLLHQHGGPAQYMTLRDHFAGLAMQSLLLHPQFLDDSYKKIAEHAYLAANAMLVARSTTTKGNQ
jgi:hypothetical protein